MQTERCLGCMNEYDASFDVCPHCGYIKGTPAKSRNHLSPGTVLVDRYLIGRCLGQGGFGITYIAWDTRLCKKVAIKEFMPNSLASRITGQTDITCYNEEAQQRFQNGIRRMLDESRRLARFKDLESVVEVYDCFEANCTAYIIMELLDGENIKDVLDENGAMTLPEVCRIMSPVLLALREIHASGLIHRDISPDNIFLCKNGKVKLLDFGSARVASGEDDKSLSVILKPGYAPKEQYSGRAKQGPYTDVYAVCATIYKMLTGVTPIDSLDRKAQRDTLRPIESLVQIPRSIADVLTRGMAVEAKDRLQTVDPLIEALSPGDGKPTPPRRPFPWKAVLIAIAAILVVVGAVFALPRIKEAVDARKAAVEPVTEEATQASSGSDGRADEITQAQQEMLDTALRETLPTDEMPQPSERAAIEESYASSRVFSADEGKLYAEYRDGYGRLLLREQIELPQQDVKRYTLYRYVDKTSALKQDVITYLCADVPEDEDAEAAEDAVFSAERYFYNMDDDTLFAKSSYKDVSLTACEEYPSYLDGKPQEMILWTGGEKTATAVFYAESAATRMVQKDLNGVKTFERIEYASDRGTEEIWYAADGKDTSKETRKKTGGRLTEYTKEVYGHIEVKYTWTYDGDLLTKHSAFGRDGEPVSSIEFSYEEEALTSVLFRNENGDETLLWYADGSYEATAYRDAHQPAEKSQYDVYGDPPTERTEYIYDKNGLLTRENIYEGNDSNPKRYYEYAGKPGDAGYGRTLYNAKRVKEVEQRLDADGSVVREIRFEHDGDKMTKKTFAEYGKTKYIAEYTYKGGKWDTQTLRDAGGSVIQSIAVGLVYDRYTSGGKTDLKQHSDTIQKFDDYFSLD